MKELEKKIGYEFRDPELFRLAMTHSSYANENGGKDNERLEFLGDSVLGFVSAEYFYRNLPDEPEGILTRDRAAQVCEKALAEFARSIGLGGYLLLGKGESASGGADKSSVLSDAFEALIAAIYLDGGLENAKRFVLSFVDLGAIKQEQVVDYKTKLQEIIQHNPEDTLDYVLSGESGPAHDPSFEVDVVLDGNVIATGVGKSKKKAEQDAARQALELMGIKL